jgi:hypothetical protein
LGEFQPIRGPRQGVVVMHVLDHVAVRGEVVIEVLAVGDGKKMKAKNERQRQQGQQAAPSKNLSFPAPREMQQRRRKAMHATW